MSIRQLIEDVASGRDLPVVAILAEAAKKRRKRKYKPRIPTYQHYDPSVDPKRYAKGRNPFKHFYRKKFLGPGPEQHVHLPANIPWDCNVVPGEKYHYVCVKRDPMTGKPIRTKKLRYDPLKKQERNRRYRQNLKQHIADLKKELEKSPGHEHETWQRLAAGKKIVRFQSDVPVTHRYVSYGHH